MTIAWPDTDISQGYTVSGRHCDGCPRCQDDNAPWCKDSHPEFRGRHPVCKKCGHCVLNGQHRDNTDDLRRA